MFLFENFIKSICIILNCKKHCLLKIEIGCNALGRIWDYEVKSIEVKEMK
jgi:hypothetical protein